MRSGGDGDKWAGMGPEVRFESRAEQRSQRVEMR